MYFHNNPQYFHNNPQYFHNKPQYFHNNPQYFHNNPQYFQKTEASSSLRKPNQNIDLLYKDIFALLLYSENH